jgi:peroxiredoxin Q/BCP
MRCVVVWRSPPSPRSSRSSHDRVGDRAPDFEIPLANGSQVWLAELVARGPVVAFFYPMDRTPGCTAEVCSFRDAYAAFTDGGAQVVGIARILPLRTRL